MKTLFDVSIVVCACFGAFGAGPEAFAATPLNTWYNVTPAGFDTNINDFGGANFGVENVGRIVNARRVHLERML